MTPPFDDVAIIGLGVVGGSLARAISSRLPRCRVHGIDPDADALRAASDAGAIASAAEQPGPLLNRCSLVVVCAPLTAVESIFQSIAPYLSLGTLVTDVAGLKGPVARWAAAHLSVPFVGGHPMAGGPVAGFEASRKDLFERAPVALCPDAGTDATFVDRLAALWRTVGAEPVVTTPDQHDRWAAEISHLPYAVAIALLQGASDDALRMAGQGFVRATHYAEFDPAVMAAVAGRNPFLRDALRSLARTLDTLADDLDANDATLTEAATRARARRAQWLADDDE